VNREIRYKQLPKGSPAAAGLNSGAIYIDPKTFNPLIDDHKLIVLLHENSHLKGYRDELAADTEAFKEYAPTGRSLINSVTAMTRILDDNNPEHRYRAWVRLQQALEYQKKQQQMQTTANREHSYYHVDDRGNIIQYLGNGSDAQSIEQLDDDYVYFLGLGKNAKKKKAIRLEKKQANVDIKKSKAYAMRTLADQGVQYKTGLQSVAEAAGQILGGQGQGGGSLPGLPDPAQPKVVEEMNNKMSAIEEMLGKFSSAQNNGATTPPPPPPDTKDKDKDKEKKNMNMMIGVGVGVLLLIVIIFFVTRKK
jgi:hypothetical protein